MEFESFPKIPQLKNASALCVTEKIDGTNAQIHILANPKSSIVNDPPFGEVAWEAEKLKDGAILVEGDFILRAGSRNRYLTERSDNFGWWKWVNENKDELVKLGPGRHFGEWWGVGIGPRQYGLADRRFSLFNVLRWNPDNPNKPACCHVVPTIATKATWGELDGIMENLSVKGSIASPGYMLPEGIVLYHYETRSYMKLTYKEGHKGGLRRPDDVPPVQTPDRILGFQRGFEIG